ncbi:MAG: hypothetical protein WKG00_21850 [Polyangiaceae bacterium]
MTDQTLLAPNLSTPHEPGTNLVWTAAMSLAWRELQALAGGPIVLAASAGDPAEAAAARAAVEALNSGMVDPSIVDPEAYVARAGYETEAFLAEVRAELARKMPDATPRWLPATEAPDRFIAWAYLRQHLRFDVPFFRPAWALHFRGSYVECFGLPKQRDAAEWERRARQIRVHHPCYTEEEVERMSPEDWDVMYDHFVVELHATRPDIRLFVATVPPAATLGETVQRALGYVDRHPDDHPHARLDMAEQFAAPILDIDVVREWTELRGRAIAAGPLAEQKFADVLGGALPPRRGGATMASEWISSGLSLPPRDLLCSRPFLVMILRRARRPRCSPSGSRTSRP